jgi:8-oxo-dGTP pyrophosphatase MutT (NUDIX family)
VARVRVVGSTGGGAGAPEPPAFVMPLGHGVDPAVVAHDAGYAVLRPLAATRDPDGELVLQLLVRPLTDEPRPVTPRRGKDAGLRVPAGVEPQVRQRFAAYAIVTSSSGLLATEYSDQTAVSGRWGMPGGGIDDGEQPVAAVLREVAEETDQQIELGDLVVVQTSHWIGRSPRGTLEDFQAVRLIYRATCPRPTEPRVLDLGGTTESARWVPLDSWRSLPWTQNWDQVLHQQLSPRRPADPDG